MSTQFEKIYVGKGKKEKYSTRITLDMDLLKQHAYEYEGKNLVTIEVVELKNPDNFGRTHSAYVTKRTNVEETSQVQEDTSKKKGRKKQK